MARSFDETMYHDGIVFHAASGTVAPNAELCSGFCVAAITRASGAGRSWQKFARNFARSTKRKPRESGTSAALSGGSGNFLPAAGRGSLASGGNAATEQSEFAFRWLAAG